MVAARSKVDAQSRTVDENRAALMEAQEDLFRAQEALVLAQEELDVSKSQLKALEEENEKYNEWPGECSRLHQELEKLSEFNHPSTP